MIYELWTDGTYVSQCIGEHVDCFHTMLEADATVEWTYDAISANDAFRGLYKYCDWGEYHPMLKDDGTPYEEDERPFEDMLP